MKGITYFLIARKTTETDYSPYPIFIGTLDFCPFLRYNGYVEKSKTGEDIHVSSPFFLAQQGAKPYPTVELGQIQIHNNQ